MANYAYSLTFQDEDGDVSRMRGYLIAADNAAALTQLQAIGELAQALSGASLTGADMTLNVDISGWTLNAVPDAGADVEVGGRFIFRSSGGFYATLTIPGFLKEVHAVAGGNIPNVAGDVADFVNAVIGATGGGATNHYEDLTALVKAYEVFNGSR